MASSNRSRSHLPSNCSQESLRDLRRCCFLLLNFLRLRLACLVLYCYPVEIIEIGVNKCFIANVKPQVSFLCLHPSHQCRPTVTLLPVTSCLTRYYRRLRPIEECIHLVNFIMLKLGNEIFSLDKDEDEVGSIKFKIFPLVD